ncbi:hypothetical protein AV530_002534 [Patagioenas fasciata monilis]|uniref:Uncharacterized protein n=1 Tax=Patagioenas fasciata monilis TaxID=372326 RepID=A0A1V4K6T1_PATFA|nr:hypothetical protein AV530_002534 [Patagioenas fasciata monilis]
MAQITDRLCVSDRHCIQKFLIVWKPINSTPKTSNSNIKLSTRKTFFPFPKPHNPWKQGDLPEVNKLKASMQYNMEHKKPQRSRELKVFSKATCKSSGNVDKSLS